MAHKIYANFQFVKILMCSGESALVCTDSGSQGVFPCEVYSDDTARRNICFLYTSDAADE